MAKNNNKENFLGFFSDLANYMQKQHPRICLYGYGSCFCDKGKAPYDMDGGIIYSRLISDKEKILEISKRLNILLHERNIDPKTLNFNLLDRISARDGRFLSYDAGYVAFLQKYGKILSGPDFLKDLKGLDNKFGELQSAAFNLRAIRNDFLMFYPFVKEKGLKKLLKAVWLLENKPKKISNLRIYRENEGLEKYSVLADELDRKNKRDFLVDLGQSFPNLDLSVFEELDRLRDPSFLDTISSDHKELARISSRILDTYEGIIKEYIKSFPPIKKTVETFL